MKNTLKSKGKIAATAFALMVTVSACSSASASSFTGVWGEPDALGMPSITIESDGTYSGTDGCNRLGGEIKISEDEATFAPGFSTMMACDDVDVWLSQAATGRISGNSLEISDVNGKVLGILEKQ